MASSSNQNDTANVPMIEKINKYIAQLADTVEATRLSRERGQATTDYTVTNFAETKRDRLWRLKVDGKLIDAVLIAADGVKEVCDTIRTKKGDL